MLIPRISSAQALLDDPGKIVTVDAKRVNATERSVTQVCKTVGARRAGLRDQGK